MSEFLHRVLRPLVLPLGAAVVAGIVIINFSRILLAVSKDAAPVIALFAAAGVLFGCAYFATSVKPTSAANVAVPILTGIVLVTSGLVAYAHSTPAKKAGGEKGPVAIGPPVATVTAFDLGFRQKQISAPAGDKVVLGYKNEGSALHTLVIDGVLGFKLSAPGGREVKGPAKLTPGTYTFFCDIPGHRQAGMEGTLTVAAGPAGAAAPGGAPAGGGSTKLALEAGDLFLKPTALSAPSGTVEVDYSNTGSALHTLVIEGVVEFKKLTVAKQGAKAVGSAKLAPGTYTLYCDVPGHRAAGMEAKLTVT